MADQRSEVPAMHKWMNYLTDIQGDEENLAAGFLWCQQDEGGDCSVEKGEGICPVDESRKRPRDDTSTRETTCSKATREKMRRDRLNDRFLELSKALEPGKAPKTDKATILCDAIRVLSQLRSEASSLKEANNQLRDQVKELKAEKTELRDEKVRLKEEKERLEQQLKNVPPAAGFMPHAAMQAAAAAAYAAQASAVNAAAKAVVLPSPAPTFAQPPPMWQWLPPAAIDTSQDHVLRPPVA